MKNISQDLIKLAELIKKRNAITKKIANLIGWPAEKGSVFEYIASKIFDISLESSRSHKGNDGHFNKGMLAGKSVNIKYYTQRDTLDINPKILPDYYLVFTGPKSKAKSTRGETLPWIVQNVYLFNASNLINDLQDRVKIGTNTSIRRYSGLSRNNA